jgi:hypothetical protein
LQELPAAGGEIQTLLILSDPHFVDRVAPPPPPTRHGAAPPLLGGGVSHSRTARFVASPSPASPSPTPPPTPSTVGGLLQGGA